MPHSMRLAGLVLTLGLGAALSACASPATPGASPASADEVYDCLGTPVAASVLAAEPSLDTLTAAGQDAVASATFEGIEPLVLDEDDGWFVVSEAEETIVLLRALDPSEHPGGEAPTGDHEMLTVAYVGDATNADPGWYVMGHSTCSLRADLGAWEGPEVDLDPNAPPDPNETEIALLVGERACNSGEDAAGRIEVIELTETETTVEFVLGIVPRGGAQTCQGNPQTPFTLELAEPLGDRMLFDAGMVPARQLSPDPES